MPTMILCRRCAGDGEIGADGGEAYIDPGKNIICPECNGRGEYPAAEESAAKSWQYDEGD